MTAPVLLAFYSRSRMPASGQLADDLATLSGEFEGKFLAGLVDIDVSPAIAQAVQVPSVPYVMAVIDGRPAPLLQDAVPLEELRTALTQVMQQLTTQGITGRHQPRGRRRPGGSRRVRRAAGRPEVRRRRRTRSRPTTSTAPWPSTRSWSTRTPPTPRPPPACRWRRCCSAPRASTSTRPAPLPRPTPDDVAAQIMVADLDLLGGHVDDAFNRLIDLIRRTFGDDRDPVREHLLGLFAAVGNDDPRVLKARQNLASALF